MTDMSQMASYKGLITDMSVACIEQSYDALISASWIGGACVLVGIFAGAMLQSWVSNKPKNKQAGSNQADYEDNWWADDYSDPLYNPAYDTHEQEELMDHLVRQTEELGGYELCEDEGCPQFGKPHVCINSINTNINTENDTKKDGDV